MLELLPLFDVFSFFSILFLLKFSKLFIRHCLTIRIKLGMNVTLSILHRTDVEKSDPLKNIHVNVHVAPITQKYNIIKCCSHILKTVWLSQILIGVKVHVLSMTRSMWRKLRFNLLCQVVLFFSLVLFRKYKYCQK